MAKNEKRDTATLKGRVSKRCANGCVYKGTCFNNKITKPYCEVGYDETYNDESGD